MITRLFLAIFAVYAVVSLLDMQMHLAQRRQELDELRRRFEIQRLENKELARKIAEDMDADDIERIARENGYVAPDERVFIDISGR